ncbi:TRAP transporter large permease [Stappia stellulata]|uniref:TRAP transporter large permease n=1 Tax=Stappia stellulata TaxID=71235 RepID=UPI0003FDED72|nr:TRAP transporter large permease [Stappia stellulata]
MTWILFASPLLLLALGFPIYSALLLASAVIMSQVMHMPGLAMHQYIFSTLNIPALVAIPFFIFAGDLMARGTLARALIDWVTTLLKGQRGGLGTATIGASTLFGAISGSGVATVAAIGRITHGPMISAGYSKGQAEAIIASSAAISSVVPPSIAMILYGVAAEQSAAELFIAGIIPGLLLALFLVVVARAMAPKEAKTGRASLAAILGSTRRALVGLGMPVVVLGGIYLGFLSPTEAAGIACAYAIVATIATDRKIAFAHIWNSARQTVIVTSQILIIVAASGVYSWVLTVNGIPQALSMWLGELNAQPWVVLLLINILLLAVGCVLDTASAILVMTPLLLPAVLAAGVDPIHFGIIVTLNLSIGMFTPPLGLNIFVTQALFNSNIASLYRWLVPLIGASVIALLIITFVPELSLFLVGR